LAKNGLRVLVADDHDSMRKCLVDVLDRDFVVIGAVSNGHDLINAAVRMQPDVIVSDVQMPLLSGTEAMRSLQDGGLDIPFVFVCSDESLVEQVTQNFGTCIHKVDLLSKLADAVLCAVVAKLEL
jgi:CheY-like chemotaxis protein